MLQRIKYIDMLFSLLNIETKSNFFYFSSKIEKFYYKIIHWRNFTSIIDIFILKENIEVYIRDVLKTSEKSKDG